MLGFLTSGWLLYRYAKSGRSQLPAEKISDFMVAMVIGVMVGGRLGSFLLYHPGQLVSDPLSFFRVWEGGMAFFGAIASSTLTLVVLARRNHFSFWLAFDAGTFFATVGQPIGRIGNIINGDILGPPSTAPWATAYTNPAAILQPGFALCTPQSCTAYEPAALYEAVGTLLILGALLLLRRRGVRTGLLGISYVAMYAVSQLVIFHWRAGMATYHGLAQAQWTAVATLLVAVPVLVLLWNQTGRGGDVRPVASGGEAGNHETVAIPEGSAVAGGVGSRATSPPTE